MTKISILSLGLLLFLFGCCEDCDSNSGRNDYHYINDTSDTLDIVVMKAYDYSVDPPIHLLPIIILAEYQIFPGDTLISEANANEYGNAEFEAFGESVKDSVSITFLNVNSSLISFSCIQGGAEIDCDVTGNPLSEKYYEKVELEGNNQLYTYRFGDYF